MNLSLTLMLKPRLYLAECTLKCSTLYIPFLYGESSDVKNTTKLRLLRHLATANCTAVFKTLKRKTLNFKFKHLTLTKLLTKIIFFVSQTRTSFNWKATDNVPMFVPLHRIKNIFRIFDWSKFFGNCSQSWYSSLKFKFWFWKASRLSFHTSFPSS